MSALTPGFADPVLDAQAAFRAVLEAMSRPGRVQRAGPGLAPPAPLMPAAAAVLLALADSGTPLFHDGGEAADAWLRFHAGAPASATLSEAAFVLATGAPPTLSALGTGTEEEPERGATLVLQVAGLSEGRGWRLAGPGVEHEHRLVVEGLGPGFVRDWAANRALFPRGVDVVLCAGEHLAALPRGIAIAEG
jgi:alpha-D-ribose 1-methylphosphonate 5-triphosphate synthase subunit PhnH